MFLLPVHISDDRGRRVRLVAHRAIYILPFKPVLLPGRKDPDRAAQQRAQEIIARAQRLSWSEGIRWQAGLVIGVCALAPVGLAILLPYLPLPQSGRSAVYVPIGAVFGLAVGILMRSAIDRAAAPRVHAALLGERICASCAYDLSSSPRDADGLTPCPECGAAWRV